MTERSRAARSGSESRGGDRLTLEAADVDEREHPARDGIERAIAARRIDERRNLAVGDAGANIEHLVIGPPGVFTITTKNLSGKVWVGPKSILHNRRRTDFLPKASAEARQASRLLSSAIGRPVEVRGVLAILCDDWTVKQRPADVYVDATRGVKDWMQRQPAILRAQEVIELVTAASKPGTWIEVHPEVE